jgi:hypothetical protein
LKLDSIFKWVATVILVMGSVMNGMNLYPWAQITLMIGGVCWFIVAYMWRDYALMATNGIMNLAVLGGLLYNFF